MAQNPMEIDWSKYLPQTSNFQGVQPGALNFQGIAQTLNTPRQTYTGATFPAVLPLLQEGIDPYLQASINSIVEQGKQSKARTLADVTTSAQSRGLTGSSIESGDIAQASYQQELGQQGQISNIIAQDQAQKRQMLVNFLVQEYNLDTETANTLAQNMAQLMGQEMGRQSDMEMLLASLKAQKANKQGILGQIAPSLIGLGSSLLGAGSGSVFGKLVGLK